MTSRAFPENLHETRQTLLETAGRSFGALPKELVVDHVLAFTGGADFAVRLAALEALQRRWRFARRDELSVASRPAGGRVLGPYTTKRSHAGKSSARRGSGSARRRGRKGEPRPYTAVLESFAPLKGSCDCPDFLRSSLGLCKHLLVVLDDVCASKKRRQAAGSEAPAPRKGPQLVWDPRLPLGGPNDRLLGLELRPGAPRRDSARADAKAGGLTRLFPRGRLDRQRLDSPKKRYDLLAELEAALRKSKGVEADPAVRALVAEELERAARRSESAAHARRTLKHQKTLRRKLYPYQTEGLTRFLESGRLLLADDMGLGKTTQAIAAAHVLFESGRIRRGLFVVPAALRSQWLREWEQTSGVPCAVVEGTPEDRAAKYRKLRSGFAIIGYEQLLRDFEHIQRLAPELVVLDEAQRIKNYATKSAVYVKSLDPTFRLVLTGTPMENRLEELASILDWVDDLALAPKWRLVPWHTLWTGDAGQRGKAGARNLDTLRARLAPSVVRRVRQDVLAQLPSRTDTRIPVEMTPQQRAAHDELNDPIKQLIAASRRRPLRQPEFLRLMALLTQQRIISNGLGQLKFEEVWPAYRNAMPDASLIDGLFAPKLAELRRLIEDLVLEQRRKVVVFSQWRRMLRLAEWSLRDLLARDGARAAFFTGAERPRQRTQSIVDFHDDPDVRILFLSDAGGVGLNLQRAANACINLELPWNPAVLEQRIGRIYRLGQKDPIDVFHFVSEYGIESRIAGVVGTKKALFSGLFDGTTDQIQFASGASFLHSVEKLVQVDDLPEAPPPLDADGAPDEDEARLDVDGAGADEEQSALADEIPAMAPGAAESRAAAAQAAAAQAAAPQPAAPQPAAPQTAAARHAARTNGHPKQQGQPPSEAPAGSPAALFDSLTLDRTPDGGIRIEAPPGAAEQLVELFAGMARLLEGARGRAGGPGAS